MIVRTPQKDYRLVTVYAIIIDTFFLQVVELLVGQGADVTTANGEGQTAVELASTTVIRQLLLAAVDKGGPHHNLCQAAWQGNAALLHRILVYLAIIDR